MVKGIMKFMICGRHNHKNFDFFFPILNLIWLSRLGRVGLIYIYTCDVKMGNIQLLFMQRLHIWNTLPSMFFLNYHFHKSKWVDPMILDEFEFFEHLSKISHNLWTFKFIFQKSLKIYEHLRYETKCLDAYN